MPNYDPTYEALVTDTLAALDDQPTDAALSYVDKLRRLQGVLTTQLTRGIPDPSPEVAQAVRHAVARLDPHAEDGYAGYATLLKRFQAALDIELARWTSALVQPAGPSGTTAVAEPQTLEAPPPPPEEP